MAIVISNSQPSPFSSTPTALFRETKADKTTVNISTRIGFRPAPETIVLTLKNYEDDELYKDLSDFKFYYEITGDDFIEVVGLAQEESVVGAEKIFSLNFPKFELLTPGQYQSALEIQITGINDLGELELIDTVLIEPTLDINAMDLTLSEHLLFAHHVKDSVPSWTASIDVFCNDVWTMLNADPSILLINGSDQQHWNFAGDEELTFTLNPDVNELELGYHKAKVYFYQPSLVAELTVHIVISAGDGLLVTPTELNFMAIRYVHEAEHQYSHVYSDNFTLSGVPSWLVVLQETFAYATDYYRLNIKPVESLNLLPGNYEANIVVTAGALQETINIKHSVLGEWDVNYDKDIHFTNDNEILKLYSQSIEDTYVKLEGEIKVYDLEGNVKTLNRDWSLSFLDNIAEINLGREVNDYLNFIQSPVKPFTSFLVPQYKPLSIKITVREIRYEDETIVAMYNIPYQYFLKGRRPFSFNENFWLTHHPNDIVRVTKNSIIELNVFKGYGTPHEIQVKRNGELHSTITWSTDSNYAQPIFMNRRFTLSSISNLEAGEKIGFVYGGVQRNFIVIPEQKHSINIAYITQFETLEIFEFTGEHSLPVDYESVLTENFIDWKTVLRKLESNKIQKLFINTGWIFKSNIRIVDEIIDSKKAFIVLSSTGFGLNTEDRFIEMVAVGKKLTGYDSKRSLYDFEVEFQINLKHEDTIYLR